MSDANEVVFGEGFTHEATCTVRVREAVLSRLSVRGNFRGSIPTHGCCCRCVTWAPLKTQLHIPLSSDIARRTYSHAHSKKVSWKTLSCGVRVAARASRAIRASHHTQTHACDQHTAHSTFPEQAPRSEHGRAQEVYAGTQPFGHPIGIDPKSSWRRWRALTETQPAGQLLMNAALRKSQASWVVSNGAVLSPS